MTGYLVLFVLLSFIHLTYYIPFRCHVKHKRYKYEKTGIGLGLAGMGGGRLVELRPLPRWPLQLQCSQQIQEKGKDSRNSRQAGVGEWREIGEEEEVKIFNKKIGLRRTVTRQLSINAYMELRCRQHRVCKLQLSQLKANALSLSCSMYSRCP